MQATLQLGKLQGRTLAATGATGPSSSRLFHVQDTHTHTRFLVDTGSEVSVLPPSPSDRRHPPDKLSLMAVNNTPIATYGKRSLTLNLGLRRSLRWIFVIADVRQPIRGADFLRHFGLLVDMKQHQLMDSATHFHVQGILSTDSSPHPSVCLKHTNDPYHSLLSEFPLPRLTRVCSPDSPILHDVTHHIETTGRPISARPR